MSSQWLPKGFRTITPNIIVDDAEQAVAFLKKALGATKNYRLTMSNGTITHCELKIGDSTSFSAHQWRAGLRAGLSRKSKLKTRTNHFSARFRPGRR